MSHDDEVTRLPEGATLLAGNDWSAIQAAEIKHKKGTFWGVQYHPEYNLHEMARLILARQKKLMQLGYFRDEEDAKAYATSWRLHEEPTAKTSAGSSRSTTMSSIQTSASESSSIGSSTSSRRLSRSRSSQQANRRDLHRSGVVRGC
jgi:hypothetical protein